MYLIKYVFVLCFALSYTEAYPKEGWVLYVRGFFMYITDYGSTLFPGDKVIIGQYAFDEIYFSAMVELNTIPELNFTTQLDAGVYPMERMHRTAAGDGISVFYSHSLNEGYSASDEGILIKRPKPDPEILTPSFMVVVVKYESEKSQNSSDFIPILDTRWVDGMIGEEPKPLYEGGSTFTAHKWYVPASVGKKCEEIVDRRTCEKAAEWADLAVNQLRDVDGWTVKFYYRGSSIRFKLTNMEYYITYETYEEVEESVELYIERGA